MSVWDATLDFVVKNKEVLGAAAAVLGAGGGALWKAMSQARKPDASASESAAYTPRQAVVRLHHDDRTAVGELKDVVCDLTRAVRRHGEQVADHAEILNRRGGRRD